MIGRVDGLTPLTYDRLLAWHEAHPDAYIVTDVKVRNVEGLSVLAEKFDRRRVIPQIYSFEEYDPAKALGYPSLILTLYRLSKPDAEVVDFVRKHPLLSVTMPKDFALTSTLPKELRALKTNVCLHTVNRIDAGKYSPVGNVCYYTDDLEPR
jgi:glycerophosphoryl diester phosphodiesterase